MVSVGQPPVLGTAGAPGTRRWGLLFALVLAAIVAGFWVLHRFPPEGNPFYPKCGLFLWTGLHCPGCGSFRALHHLAHGRWLAAVHANALLTLALGGGIAWTAWRVARRSPPWPRPGQMRSVWLAWGLGLFLAFGVVRNLPWWPFTLLAP